MSDRTNVSHSFYTSATNEQYITDGVKTLKKISGFKIVAIAASIIAGLAGMLYVFITGWIKLAKYKLSFFRMPLSWIFTALLSFVGSIILIATQPFMEMGNRSIGNILLALSTVLIPTFAMVSVFLYIKTEKRYSEKVSFWALICILQFCALLIANNLMPMIMWK
jgi:hypothetical protein